MSEAKLAAQAGQSKGGLEHKRAMDGLAKIKASTGEPLTFGLRDDVVLEMLKSSVDLQEVVATAYDLFQSLPQPDLELLKLSEKDLIARLQEGILNFYAADCGSPYVPLCAQGPWVITGYGAVVYDAGGYGMLGFGHNPKFLKERLGSRRVMANVMTPQFSQMDIVDKLRREIGKKRGTGCPFTRFVFLNSGSEAMSFATRISDVNARVMTDPGARHHGRTIRFLGFQGGFHGRTTRPAQASDSSKRGYMRMATFRDREFLWTIPPNDESALRAVYERADRENVFLECFFVEPVMGEGNPGLSITPEFYKVARELTLAHGSMLVVDSIQAGLRAHGFLSVVDYPGFEGLEAPDMESYSKALNAGQYPLSVLGLTDRAAELYSTGLYGNTMTANARALDVGLAVLDHLTDELSENIRQAGVLLLKKLNELMTRFPGDITKVQGTGLLVSVEFRDGIKVFGADSLEYELRLRGLNVIHGGKNSLRFTPVFNISREEVELLVGLVEEVVKYQLSRQESA
jgi:acetylornithine/succinyldiaminopimelate/putrescine aminotransferase